MEKTTVIIAENLQSSKTFCKLGQYHKSGSTFSQSLHVNAHSNSHRLGNKLWTLSPWLPQPQEQKWKPSRVQHLLTQTGLEHLLVGSRGLLTPGWTSNTTNGYGQRVHGPPTAYAGYTQAQHQRAKERAERQEARHEAQMRPWPPITLPPNTISPATPKVPTGFNLKSNQCFFKIAPFSGEDAQPLRPWSNDSWLASRLLAHCIRRRFVATTSDSQSAGLPR